MSGDLAAFLNARLDEVEAAAKAVEDNSEPWPGQWEADGNYALRTHNGWVLAAAGTPGSEFKPGVLAHIARHDPARVLREVAAWRRVVRDYQEVDEAFRVRGGEVMRAACDAYARCMLHGAAIWRGHPDYRPEWEAG